MTTTQLRTGVVWVLRLAFYGLTFALLLQRCTGDDGGTNLAGFTIDPEARQVECYENDPPLFYDAEGTCFSQDPTFLTAAERAAVAVVPAVRLGTFGPTAPQAPGGPVAPGSAGGGQMPPGLVDPRSSAAAPPPALRVPIATGTTTTGTTTTGTVDAAPGGQPAADAPVQQQPATPVTGQGNPTATATAQPDGTSGPTSPSLAYIAEDGRSDTITKGPTINGIQVWVHEPSRTLYADSCEVLQTITGLDKEFGPTPEAPGYGAICPQL